MCGLRAVRVGEASNHRPSQSLQLRRRAASQTAASRSSAEPTIFSSDDEPLLPGSVDSRSTVPASIGALREAGVESREFSQDVMPTVHDEIAHSSFDSQTLIHDSSSTCQTPASKVVMQLTTRATRRIFFWLCPSGL